MYAHETFAQLMRLRKVAKGDACVHDAHSLLRFCIIWVWGIANIIGVAILTPLAWCIGF